MTKREQESGLTPIIAEILMVALVCLAAVIAYVIIFQIPALEKIPMLAVDITKDGDLITISHKNGDSLEQGTFYVSVNGERMPDGNLTLIGGAYPWSPGEKIQVRYPESNPIREVNLIYAGPSVSVVLASEFFPGPSGNITPPAPTPTPTLTPTPTKTIAPTPTPTRTPAPPVPFNTISLNTARQGDLLTGGSMQFRVTGLWSTIVHGSDTYNLIPGDTVRLTTGNDKKGHIDATSGSITSFSFNGVGLSINGVSTGPSRNLNSIWINGYDSYASTLTLDVPSHNAWTQLIVDGNTLIYGDNSSHIQIVDLSPSPSGGGMILDTTAGSSYYVGGASSYSVS